MKSEKAKAYIEDKFISEYNDIEHYLVYFGKDGTVLEKSRIGRYRRYADKAVELAEQEAEERLTRWNDPKEALPEIDKMVLVKRKSDAPLPYDLAQYDGSCWIDSWCGLMIEIIGWREIHE